jgi:glutathione S-transferase
MMKLYYATGACSQAPHIILHEAGLPHDSTKVDIRAKKLEDGSDYLRVNPKGAVPALELDDGQVLTENAVILQYIADRAGAFELLPQPGDLRRYRVLEWVNYVATELHKSFGPLFNPAAGDEAKQSARDLIGKKLDFVEQQIDDKPYLLGEQFTLPDAYLFVILGWTEKMQIDLDRWPKLAAFRKRVADRESVREVLEFEGLLEKAAAD